MKPLYGALLFHACQLFQQGIHIKHRKTIFDAITDIEHLPLGMSEFIDGSVIKPFHILGLQCITNLLASTRKSSRVLKRTASFLDFLLTKPSNLPKKNHGLPISLPHNWDGKLMPAPMPLLPYACVCLPGVK